MQGVLVEVGGAERGQADEAPPHEARRQIHADSAVQQAGAKNEQDPRLVVLRTGGACSLVWSRLLAEASKMDGL